MMNTKRVGIALLMTVFLFGTANAQKDESTGVKNPSNWKLESIFSLNITQSSFTNWAAGGRNSVAGLAFIDANADYTKGRIKWANHLHTGLGGVKYPGDKLQKTDDIIDLQSTLSYGLKKPWYVALMAGFRTQYLNGYANVEDSLYSSRFMAPGYVTASLGIEYIPNDHLSVLLSPITGKFTFVNDQRLADLGAFGVEPAVYNDLGDIITHGKQFRGEVGAYLRIVYNKEILKNITLKTRWEFFSNYLNNPQNIDVNGQLLLNFKINKWFSANIQLNLIYDDDIDIEDADGRVGPRTQFKEVIGIGISYRLANFEKE